jgi:hypothetical protein
MLAKLIAAMLLLGMFAGETKEPPTYKGLQCIGWAKPEAETLANGESEGESVVVNTPLTDIERAELKIARKRAEAAFAAQTKIEEDILSAHGYPIVGDRIGTSGKCGESVMIRADEYHITQFVPSNPNYPSENAPWFQFSNHEMSAEGCRGYFKELRKKAVQPRYGRDMGE